MKKHSAPLRRIAVATVSVLSLAAATAYAETAPQAAKPAAAAIDDGPQEIIVTSAKRKEKLQNVPVSVTVLGSEVIERNNIREVGDLVALSPALSVGFGSQPANFAINMRGIGTFSNGIAVESDVAVVIDDVPTGIQAAAFKDLVDIDRLEVLRGPQSTLFGKSAIAGVLNIATKNPSPTFGGMVTAMATDDNETRLGFTVTGPITPGLLFRVTGAHSRFPGLLKNLTGGHLNGTGGSTLTAKLQWSPNADWKITLAPRWNKTTDNCCVSPITSLQSGMFLQGLTQFPEATVLAGIPIGKDNVYVRNDFRAGGDSQVVGGTFRVEYNLDPNSIFGASSLASITSYDRWSMHDYQDQDGTDSPVALYYLGPDGNPLGLNSGSALTGRFHNTSFTQELRLTSPSDQKLKYVLGLWFAENKGDRFLHRGPALSVVEYLAQTNNQNAAFFFNGTYDVTPATTLIVGGRINREHVGYAFTNSGFLTKTNFSCNATTPAVPSTTGCTKLSWSTANNRPGSSPNDTVVTGKLGIQHRWNADVMTYATYSTGYKGQAYDLVSTLNAVEAATFPVKAETAKSYEIGMKTTLLDRRLTFNIDIFNTDFRNYQQSSTTTAVDGTFLTFLNSIGVMRSRGLEADGNWYVNRNLSFNGSAAYTEATIVDFTTAACYPNQPVNVGVIGDPGCTKVTSTITGKTSNVQNLNGKTLPNVPKWKFNVGGLAKWPTPDLPFDTFGTFAYRWQSEVQYSLNQDPLTIQKSYGVIDLGVGISDHQNHTKLTLLIKNALDRRYAAAVGDSSSGFSTASPTSAGTAAIGTTWLPARDSFRYVSLRLDTSF